MAAGSPVVAEDQIEEYLPLPDQFCGDADFVLAVRGDSMINAGILDGDYVVVRKRSTPGTARSSSPSSATRTRR